MDDKMPVVLKKVKLDLKTCFFVVAVYFALTVIGQWSQNGWQEEFGAHPDEAGHYITGLMTRDYLAAGMAGAPMAFAERYYRHYPKVALGHWPPLFYTIMAPWMLAFEPARVQLMLFMVLITVATALCMFAVGSRLLSVPLGFIAGLLFLGLPLTRQYSSMLMADTLNTFLCFVAVVWAGRFLEFRRWRDACVFGILAAAAVLNKGSALALALIPPLGILFSGRWVLIRRPGFWLPALIVVGLCAPWYWVAFPMMKNGFENPQSFASSAQAVLFYARGLSRMFGPFLLLLAAVGAWVGIAGNKSGTVSGAREYPSRGVWSSLAALALAVPLFHCIVTNAYDTRYLLPATPALIILMLAGARELFAICRRRWSARFAGMLVFVAFGLLYISRAAVPPRQAGIAGFGMVTSDLAAESAIAGSEWLVSSDARGEGAFIAQAAMRDESRPAFVVMRASKALAQSLWDGSGYQPGFFSIEELRAFLLDRGLSRVIIDTTIPSRYRQPHHGLLEKTMDEFSDEFQLINTYPLTRDGVFYPAGLAIYSVTVPEQN